MLPMGFPNFCKFVVAGTKKMVTDNGGKTVEKIIFSSPNDVVIAEAIGRSVGISYEIVIPSDGQHGRRLPNGSWTGMLGMLERGEACAAFSYFGMTAERSADFPFTYPFYAVGVTFMTRKHEYVPDNAVFLHPFSIQVWLSVIACICIMPFIFRFLIQKKYSPLVLLTSTFCSLLGQGMELQPQKKGEYLLLTCWLLGGSLLSYFYAAVLLSFLTFPTLDGVSTVKELAEAVQADKYQCTTYPGSYFGPTFLASNSTALQTIGKSLMQTEGTYDIVGTLEKDFKGGRKPAFLTSKEYVRPFKDLYFVSDDSFFTSFYGFPMRKNFCCISEVNRAFSRMFEAGIAQKILLDETFKQFLKFALPKIENKTPETALSMSTFMGPFLFLIVSHAFSLLVFLLELIIGNLKKK